MYNQNLSTHLSELCNTQMHWSYLFKVLFAMKTTISELGTCPQFFCLFFSPLSKSVPVSVEPSIMGSENVSVMEIIFSSLNLHRVRWSGSLGAQAVHDQHSYALKAAIQFISTENKGNTGVSSSRYRRRRKCLRALCAQV